jgi:DNA-binding transcriptional LysR family regulator
MDWTLDQLRVLDAIARTGSFARAAAELHRVPSAVSYAVRQLEEGLDVALFDRTRRKAALTPAGTRILAEARSVLDRAKDLAQLGRELADGWEPELRIVVDGALPMAPILRALAPFQDPEIPTHVRLDVEHREGVLHRFHLDNSHIMFVIGFDPGDDTSGMLRTDLPPLELVLVAAATHPLVATPTAEAAAAVPELVVRDSSPDATATESYTGSRHQLHLSDFHTKRLALLQGAGFGWIPRHLIRSDLTAGTLALLPLDGRSPHFHYAPQQVERADAPRGRALQRFIAALPPTVHKD